MYQQSRKKRPLGFASVATKCTVLALMLVGSFLAASAQERERDDASPARKHELTGTVTAAQLDAALQRGLPGRTAAHTGVGKPAVSGSAMAHVEATRVVNMADLPQKSQTNEVPGLADGGRPLSGLNEDEYRALKQLAARRAAAGEIGAKPSLKALQGGMKAIARPVQATVNGMASPYATSGGLTYFDGQTENGLDPPDMAIATSENFVVQVVNSAIGVYSKGGVLQPGFPKDADTFFGAAGAFIFDPRAFYDWANHRFVILMDTFASGSPGSGSFYIAASQTQDPRGGWYIYNINTGLGSGICGDFPTLGHDTTNWGTSATKGGIYVGVNVWTTPTDCGGASFSSNNFYLFPKDGVYSGGFGFWYLTGFSDGPTVDTLAPVSVTDRADKPSSVFFVNSFNYNFGSGHCSGGCNGLIVWALSGPTTGTVIAPHNPFAFLQGGSGPVWTAKVISTTHNYSFPVSASEPGCLAGSGPCVDTDYTFISGGTKYHAGEIFGSFNTGVATSPAVTGPIWFDLHPETDNNGQLTGVLERQEDCFLCGGWGSNGSAYYATLQPDQENNVVMIYNYSDDATYPRTQYTSRRVTYGDSLMDGAGFYFAIGSPGFMSGRWGDYTATSPDFTIATRGLLWMSGEYATSSGWRTVIGGVQYNTSADQ